MVGRQYQVAAEVVEFPLVPVAEEGEVEYPLDRGAVEGVVEEELR